MNVSDLKDGLLNYWVAKAQGMDVYMKEGYCFRNQDPLRHHSYHPSEDWEEGGEIIEREGISIRMNGDVWESSSLLDETGASYTPSGPTPLIAAMRFFVCCNFGQVVNDEAK